MKKILLLQFILLCFGCQKDSFKWDLSKTTRLPIVTTSVVSSITNTSAISGGSVAYNGESIIIKSGVCWSTTNMPAVDNSTVVLSDLTDNFNCSINNLTPNTKYYIRAFAQNKIGYAYGEVVSFTTTNIIASLPVITTNSISSVSQNSAISGAIITNQGGASILSSGVCFSTSQSPTISDTHVLNTSGSLSFVSNITGLNPNTLYYVRAYATNAVGTAYGNQQSFTTLNTAAALATISTISLTSITQTSATSGGNISSDGGSTITSKGVCYSTSQNPTFSDNKTVDGNGTGNYSSTINSLNPNTTYYVRAYAINNAGISYGNQLIFSTLTINVPTITTNSITSITQTSATSGGNISSDGGSSITSRGVCYASYQNPTLSDNYIQTGSGTGSYSTSITNLNPNSTYYVRAFAVNNLGTGYGNQYSFSTSSLGTPLLGNPINGSSVPCCYLNFDWSSVSGAATYEINISSNITFTGVTYTIGGCGGSAYPSISGVNSATVSTTNFCMNTGTSSQNGTWYWRVRATNASWSNIFSYTYKY